MHHLGLAYQILRSHLFIENPEDIDIVMPMHSMLEYIHNYSMTSGRLWDYYRNKIDEADVSNSNSDGKSFEHKKK